MTQILGTPNIWVIDPETSASKVSGSMTQILGTPIIWVIGPETSASKVSGSMTQILGTPNSSSCRILSLTLIGLSSRDRISTQIKGGREKTLSDGRGWLTTHTSGSMYLPGRTQCRCSV